MKWYRESAKNAANDIKKGDWGGGSQFVKQGGGGGVGISGKSPSLALAPSLPGSADLNCSWERTSVWGRSLDELVLAWWQEFGRFGMMLGSFLGFVQSILTRCLRIGGGCRGWCLDAKLPECRVDAPSASLA